jgi:hypothetical protein
MRLKLLYQGEEKIVDLNKYEIVIGRPTPEFQPDLPLPEFDFSASRRHARIFLKENAAWIEDLKSRQGTYVNGENIQGRGAVRLAPGAPVRLGTSTLVLISFEKPLRHLRAELTCLSEINYSRVHVDTPFLLEVTLHNRGDIPVEEIEVQIELPGYARSGSVSIRSVPAKGQFTIDPPPRFTFDRAKLTSPVEETVLLEVYADGQRLELVEPVSTQILPRDAWYCAADEAALACFVLSQSAAVKEIVQRAATFLRSLHKGVQTFEEILSSHPERAMIIAQALYGCLQERYAIAYGREPRTYAPDWQRVRFPGEIVRSLEGTCIDLALLMAACLENRHLSPVILIIQTGVGIWHALVGCWTGEPMMSEVMEWNGPAVKGWVEKGALLLLDSVGFARGAHADRSFNDCRRIGKEYLDKACVGREGHAFRFALDVCLARLNGYEPMPFGEGVEYDRESYLALACARREAERLKTDFLGARHLLLGLLHVERGWMGRVLAEFGGDVAKRFSEITCASLQSSGGSSRPPQETIDWNAILRKAEAIASERHLGYVMEPDLVRALLMTPSQVDRVIGKVGLTREKCLEALDRMLAGGPPPSLWRSSRFE